MFLIAVLVILGIIFIYFLFRTGKTSNPKNESRYSKSGNWMDFDPGVDGNKVGNSKYPNAGIDSVMKHEFMKDLDNHK